MFHGIEIDGGAGGVITQVNCGATDRTKGVSPIVELPLVYRLDLLMKVFGEIDQERRYGASASKGYACTGYSIALNSNGITILTCWPSVMTADQLLPIRDSVHPNSKDLHKVQVLVLANQSFHQESKMHKVAGK